jgi:uncharacterized protein
MVRTLVLACILWTGIPTVTNPPRGFVWDQEHVLLAQQVKQLDSLYRAHEERTGNEMALVTHPTFNGRSPVDFAVAFGDSVGVGKRERDNGVVIAISKTRRAVFVATGMGTEKVLHDSICQRIINNDMIPAFKDDRYFDGLWRGSIAIISFLERPENAIPTH